MFHHLLRFDWRIPEKIEVLTAFGDCAVPSILIKVQFKDITPARKSWRFVFPCDDET
jgi:hypothetical protein